MYEAREVLLSKPLVTNALNSISAEIEIKNIQEIKPFSVMIIIIRLLSFLTTTTPSTNANNNRTAIIMLMRYVNWIQKISSGGA